MRLPIIFIAKRITDDEIQAIESRYKIARSNADNFPSESTLKSLSVAQQRYNFFAQLKDLSRTYNKSHKEEA